MNPPCEHLDAYIDRTLSLDSATEFEAHLPDCPACGVELERQRELDHLLALAREHLEQPSAKLRDRVQRALHVAKPRRLPLVRLAPLAAAAALAFGVLLIWPQHAPHIPAGKIDKTPPALSAARAGTMLPADEAMAKLAVLATARPSARSAPVLAWLDSPAFPGAAIGVQPAAPARDKDDVGPQAEQEDDGPKRGPLAKYNAISLKSLQTLGERKLDQTIIEPLSPPKKEDIPC